MPTESNRIDRRGIDAVDNAVMDLQQLAYFVAVAEERSFTHGAAREHVVQSTVSSAISRLERELGQQLLVRGEHRITPTDAGSLLLERGRQMLAAAQEIREEIAALHGPVEGTVTIGGVLSTGTFDLGTALRKMKHRYPRVDVRIRASATTHDRHMASIVDGTFDLALLPEQIVAAPGVRCAPVGTLELSLVTGVDDAEAARPRAAPEAASLAVIDFPIDWSNRARIDAYFAEEGVRRAVLFEVTDVATAVDLIRSGLGAAFLPARLTKSLAGVQVAALERPVPTRKLILARRASPQRPAVEAVFRLLLEAGTS